MRTSTHAPPFDALAQLERALQDLGLLLPRGLARGMDDLHEAGVRLEDAVAVARGERRMQLEVLLPLSREVERSHGLERLGQVVHDEAEVRAEHLAADDVHLPPGDVGVYAVDERGVVIDGRQVLEQVGLADHVAHVVAGVSHKNKRRLR